MYACIHGWLADDVLRDLSKNLRDQPPAAPHEQMVLFCFEFIIRKSKYMIFWKYWYIHIYIYVIQKATYAACALFSRSLMIWKVLDWIIYFTLYVYIYIRYTHSITITMSMNCQDISLKCSKRPSTDSNCNCLAIHDPPNHRAACSLPWCLTSNPEKELCPKDMTGIPNGGMDMNGLETGDNEILLWDKKESHSTNELPGMKKKHRAGGVDLVGRLFSCQHVAPKYGLLWPMHTCMWNGNFCNQIEIKFEYTAPIPYSKASMHTNSLWHV